MLSLIVPVKHIIWGIWGSYCNMPKARFSVLKGDYNESKSG